MSTNPNPSLLTRATLSPADPAESCSRGPPALQPPPCSCLPSGRASSASRPRGDLSTGFVAAEDSRSESEFLPLPDYLILSNCETGRPRQARYASVLVCVRRISAASWALPWAGSA